MGCAPSKPLAQATQEAEAKTHASTSQPQGQPRAIVPAGPATTPSADALVIAANKEGGSNEDAKGVVIVAGAAAVTAAGAPPSPLHKPHCLVTQLSCQLLRCTGA